MDASDKYYELDNIISSLKVLIFEITYCKDYVNELNFIKEKAEKELEDVINELEKENKAEEKEQFRKYYEGRF